MQAQSINVTRMYTTVQNALFLRFVSDHGDQYGGFEMKISRVLNGKTTPFRKNCIKMHVSFGCTRIDILRRLKWSLWLTHWDWDEHTVGIYNEVTLDKFFVLSIMLNSKSEFHLLWLSNTLLQNNLPKSKSFTYLLWSRFDKLNTTQSMYPYPCGNFKSYEITEKWEKKHLMYA